jgi:hypothetical protein
MLLHLNERQRVKVICFLEKFHKIVIVYIPRRMKLIDQYSYLEELIDIHYFCMEKGLDFRDFCRVRRLQRSAPQSSQHHPQKKLPFIKRDKCH